MEVFIVIAVVLLSWLLWQLYRAKQFNHFKVYLQQEIKPLISERIIEELNEKRCELYPNNKYHQTATVYFWTQYPVRILQKAIILKIINIERLKMDGKWRYCQHLFFLEKHLIADIKDQQE